MKKLFKMLIVIAMLFAILPASIFGEEENIEVQMLNYSAETEYSISEYYVTYRDDYEENKYIAEIFNKETDELVQTFSEKPDIPLETAKQMSYGNVQTRATSTYDSTWDTTKTLKTINGYKIDAYVWARVNITADFSWRQVNEVKSMGHSAGGSGYFTLITGGTLCNTTNFPCGTNLSLQINGVIEISKSQSASAGFSFKLLEGLGFSMSGSSSSTWYARTPYNTSVTFKVM